MLIEGNRVSGFGNGISLYSQRAMSVEITSNELLDNNSGLSIQSVQGVVIAENIVTANSTGVRLSNSVPSLFAGNVITNNTNAGLYVSNENAELSEVFLVDGNDLSGNGTVIELRNYANVVVTGNDLSGSSQYGIANYTSNEIDARNNYWGESETDEMALGGNPKGLGFIYDGRDDGSYGTVNYAQWLEISPLSDDDKDGIDNDLDNCPLIANSDQSDLDGDGVGDVVGDRQCWGCGVKALRGLNRSSIAIPCQISGNPLGDINGDGAGAVGRRRNAQGVSRITISASEGSLASTADGDVTCGETIDRF